MNEYLASFTGFFLNDSLVSEPNVRDGYIEAAFSGEFRLVGKVAESTTLSDFDFFQSPLESSSMVGVYIFEQVTRTLADVLFETDRLRFNITKDSLALNYGSYGVLFDTTCDDPACFGRLFPEISQNHPNAAVKMVIKALTETWIGFHGELLVYSGGFNVDIVITHQNGSEETVAKLTVYLTISAAAFVFNERIVGAVYVKPVTVVDNGSPKEFAPYLSRARSVLKKFVDLVLVPEINRYGALGLPLRYPHIGLRAVNAEIELNSREFPLSWGGSFFRMDLIDDSNPSIVDAISLYDRYLSLLRQV